MYILLIIYVHCTEYILYVLCVIIIDDCKTIQNDR